MYTSSSETINHLVLPCKASTFLYNKQRFSCCSREVDESLILLYIKFDFDDFLFMKVLINTEVEVVFYHAVRFMQAFDVFDSSSNLLDIKKEFTFHL